MESRTACPSVVDLQQFLLGHGDATKVPDLEQHLLTCPDCLNRADHLAARDDLVLLMGQAANPQATPMPPEVLELQGVFQRLRPQAVAPAPAPVTDRTMPTQKLESGQPAAEFPVPTQIGPYEIRSRLGGGGMGEVYEGYDPRLQRAVAIKVIQPALLTAPGMLDRFVAEARAVAAVEQDNIVVVHAVEVHDGQPCIVMPLLRGETLESRLRSLARPMPMATVVRLGREMSAGLQAAHAQGVIHRDIKPANVWLEAGTDRVKLLDFGLALPESAASGGTEMSGTPGYMAPEQIAGKPLDARADLFSLGCVLYRAATGQPAFAADSVAALMVRTLTHEPTPTAQANPKLEPELGRLIDRLLAREMDKRPASAAVVAAELEAIAKKETAARRRRQRRNGLIAVVAAALLGALGVWWALVPVAELPGTLVLEGDADVETVIFSRDGKEHPLDLRQKQTLELGAGEYRLRHEPTLPGRELKPSLVTVVSGQERPIKLALVGEVDRIQPHTQAITGVAVVREKETIRILSVSVDQTLNVWEPGPMGREQLQRLPSPARCLVARADGSLIATAGGNKREPFDFGPHLWESTTLRPLGQPLREGSRQISALALSPDGRWMLSAATNDVRLWEIATGKERGLTGHPVGAKFFAACFDPGGKEAYTGDDSGQLVCWDLVEGKAREQWPALTQGPDGTEGSVRAVLGTPAGIVSAGDDGIVRIWSGSPRKAREWVHGKPILALALSPEGNRLLSGAADGSIKLWSLETGTVQQTLQGHHGEVSALAFVPGRREAVSGGADRTVRRWRLPFD